MRMTTRTTDDKLITITTPMYWSTK